MVSSMAGKTVIVSNQPYFYKKAELFPGSAFVIGADTAVRLINLWNYLLLGLNLHDFHLVMLIAKGHRGWLTEELKGR